MGHPAKSGALLTVFSCNSFNSRATASGSIPRFRQASANGVLPWQQNQYGNGRILWLYQSCRLQFVRLYMNGNFLFHNYSVYPFVNPHFSYHFLLYRYRLLQSFRPVLSSRWARGMRVRWDQDESLLCPN